MRLNTGKLTSGESVYTSFGKTTKNGQHLKGLDENLHKFKLTIIVTTGLIDILRSIFTQIFSQSEQIARDGSGLATVESMPWERILQGE